jgi:hypothetical protein
VGRGSAGTASASPAVPALAPSRMATPFRQRPRRHGPASPGTSRRPSVPSRNRQE